MDRCCWTRAGLLISSRPPEPHGGAGGPKYGPPWEDRGAGLLGLARRGRAGQTSRGDFPAYPVGQGGRRAAFLVEQDAGGTGLVHRPRRRYQEWGQQRVDRGHHAADGGVGGQRGAVAHGIAPGRSDSTGDDQGRKKLSVRSHGEELRPRQGLARRLKGWSDHLPGLDLIWRHHASPSGWRAPRYGRGVQPRLKPQSPA